MASAAFTFSYRMLIALRNQLGIDFIDLTKTTIDPSMSRYIPKALAQEYEIVPIQVVRDNLFIAMSDPLNFMAIERARNTSRKTGSWP